jgi:hypothetical protein
MPILNDSIHHDPSDHYRRQATIEAENRFPKYLKSVLGGQARQPEKHGRENYIPTVVIHDAAIERIREELAKVKRGIEELKGAINQAMANSPAIIPSKMYSLPSEEYELKAPVDVIFQIYPDEAMAVIPELELYGEGRTEMDALSDLKLELMDLYENLNSMSDDELGESPREWKKTLQLLVDKCQ